MGISPIGSVIFTNQMTVNASSVQNAHNNRLDLQNIMAQNLFNEKDEKVLEVRPTEENHEVDEDAEHEKDEAKAKQLKLKKQNKEEESFSGEHLLDITV